MKDLPLSLKRLIWKDFRLIFPLVGMLLGLSVFFQILYGFLIRDDYELRAVIWILLLVVPACYAVGAGAVLIGREKELDNLRWLQSLPIAPQPIVASKLIVSMVCLALVWMVSLTIYSLLFWFRLNSHFELEGLDILGRSMGQVVRNWVMLLTIVLLIGNIVAWKIRSSIGGVIAILPVFVAIMCAIFGIFSLIDSLLVTFFRSSLDSRSPWIDLTHIGFIAALGWLSWRGAISYLIDGEDHRRSMVCWPSRVRWREWIGQFSSSHTVSFANRQAYPPSSAMLWQFAKQNRWMLASIGGLLLSIPLIVRLGEVRIRDMHFLEFVFYRVIGNYSYAIGDIEPLIIAWSGMFIACLACSWLGVIAFHNDSIARRIRFFAERGIAPGRVWWTRQAIPLNILALLGMVLSLYLIGQSRMADTIRLIDTISGGTLILLGLIYSLSQWSSLIIRHSVLAAAATPIFAGGLVVYILIGTYTNELAVYVLGLWIILPMIATRVATRAWMDGDNSMRHWFVQAGFLAVLLVLPITGWIPNLLTPAMPFKSQASLFAEASTMFRESPSPEPLGVILLSEFINRQRAQILQDEAENATDSPFEARQVPALPPSREFYDYFNYVWSQVEQKLADKSLVPVPDPHVFNLFVADATLHRLGQDFTEYRREIDQLNQLSLRCRQSPSLADQDRCDLLDLWLLRECRHQEASKNLGGELLKNLVARLADREGRYRARRQAVMMSWASYERGIQQGTAYQNFGGYPIIESEHALRNRPFFLQAWTAKRRASFVTYELLECLDEMAKTWSSNEAAAIQERSRRLAVQRTAEVLSDTEPHTLERILDAYQLADEIEGYAFPENFRPHVPCGLWFGRWEEAAVVLEKEILP